MSFDPLTAALDIGGKRIDKIFLSTEPKNCTVVLSDRDSAINSG